MARQVTLNGLARALPLVTNQVRFTAIDTYIKAQPKVIPAPTKNVTPTVTTKRKAPVTYRYNGNSPDCDAGFKPITEALVHAWIKKGYGYILLQDLYDATKAVTVAQQNGVRQAIRNLKWDGGKVRAVLAKTTINGLYKVI